METLTIYGKTLVFLVFAFVALYVITWIIGVIRTIMLFLTRRAILREVRKLSPEMYEELKNPLTFTISRPFKISFDRNFQLFIHSSKFNDNPVIKKKKDTYIHLYNEERKPRKIITYTFVFIPVVILIITFLGVLGVINFSVS